MRRRKRCAIPEQRHAWRRDRTNSELVPYDDATTVLDGNSNDNRAVDQARTRHVWHYGDHGLS